MNRHAGKGVDRFSKKMRRFEPLFVRWIAFSSLDFNFMRTRHTATTRRETVDDLVVGRNESSIYYSFRFSPLRIHF